MNRTRYYSLLIPLMLSLGCFRSAAPLQRSGFLYDYSRLSKSPELNGAMHWANRGKPVGLYKMIALDPVQVLSPAGVELDPESRSQAARAFEDQLREVLSGAYPIVEHPGFGVLRVRLAISNVRPVEGGLFSSHLEASGLDLSRAVLEAEMKDSRNGDTVVMLVEEHATAGRYRRLPGNRYFDDARDIFRSWGLLIRDSLDQGRGLHGTGSLHFGSGLK